MAESAVSVIGDLDGEEARVTSVVGLHELDHPTVWPIGVTGEEQHVTVFAQPKHPCQLGLGGNDVQGLPGTLRGRAIEAVDLLEENTSRSTSSRLGNSSKGT